MYDPLTNLLSLLNLFLGIVDTTLRAMLIPVFALFNVQPPSLFSLI
jgi:hypothetical protein